MIDEMEHVEVLSRQKIQITPNRLNHLRDASTILAVAMSFFILFTYQYEPFWDETGFAIINPTVPNNIDLTIKVLGYV